MVKVRATVTRSDWNPKTGVGDLHETDVCSDKEWECECEEKERDERKGKQQGCFLPLFSTAPQSPSNSEACPVFKEHATLIDISPLLGKVTSAALKFDLGQRDQIEGRGAGECEWQLLTRGHELDIGLRILSKESVEFKQRTMEMKGIQVLVCERSECASARMAELERKCTSLGVGLNETGQAKEQRMGDGAAGSSASKPGMHRGVKVLTAVLGPAVIKNHTHLGPVIRNLTDQLFKRQPMTLHAIKWRKVSWSLVKNTGVLMANVIQAQPSALIVQTSHQSNWSTGLCNVCADISVCCCGLFCMPCLQCQTTSNFGEGCCLPLLDPCILSGSSLSPVSLAMRAAIRERYGIQGSICDDCCVLCCCFYCAWCQMAREVQIRSKHGTTYVAVNQVVR
ncbi:CNFN protein, partial [Polypterus senegalus]